VGDTVELVRGWILGHSLEGGDVSLDDCKFYHCCGRGGDKGGEKGVGLVGVLRKVRGVC